MANANSNELKKATGQGDFSMGTMTEPKETWDRHAIKAAIQRKGYTLTDIAKLYGISPQSVRNALDTPSKAGEVVIAKVLNIEVQVLFPERWTKDGKRIIQRNNSTVKP